ncbi:hypothetical protein D3C80_2204220 [compost metagenome]
MVCLGTWRRVSTVSQRKMAEKRKVPPTKNARAWDLESISLLLAWGGAFEVSSIV